MKLTEAKILFKAGVLSNPQIIEQKNGGWQVLFDIPDDLKNEVDPIIYTERGSLRIYKSSDAAIRSIHEVGFNKATIVLQSS